MSPAGGHPAAAAREQELETIIAAHVAGLRGACSREMRRVMDQSKACGDLADAAAATWVYQLAEVVMSCNKLADLIEARRAADKAADKAGEVEQ